MVGKASGSRGVSAAGVEQPRESLTVAARNCAYAEVTFLLARDEQLLKTALEARKMICRKQCSLQDCRACTCDSRFLCDPVFRSKNRWAH
jgi:hypothetical protein